MPAMMTSTTWAGSLSPSRSGCHRSMRWISTGPMSIASVTSMSRSARSSPRVDPALEHRPHHVAARLDDVLVGLVVLLAARHVREDARHDRREAGVRLRPHVGEQQHQVVADRLALRQRRRRLQRRQRVVQQRVLAGPAPVDRRLAHPGPGGDRLDGQHVHRHALGEQVQRRLDDRLVRADAPRSTRRPRSVCDGCTHRRASTVGRSAGGAGSTVEPAARRRHVGRLGDAGETCPCVASALPGIHRSTAAMPISVTITRERRPPSAWP